MLLQAIAMLAPALIAVSFYSHLHRNKIKTHSMISSYGIFVVFINLCLYLISAHILNIETLNFDDRTFIKYTLAASAFAFILPLVVNLIESSLSVEVNKNVKKQTRNAKKQTKK